ncbi:MAG: hypothetical protein H8D23_38760 [Candidatus Brocadiales bacterium]|nr:hypothetical protein [Candidatus Brocadiales bacterium]
MDRCEAAIEAYVRGDRGYLTQSAQFTVKPISEKTLFSWVAAICKNATDFLKIISHFLNEHRPDWTIEKDPRLSEASFPLAHTSKKNNELNNFYQVFILRDYFVPIVEPKYYLCWLIFQTRLSSLRPTQLDNEELVIIRDNSPP